MFCSKYPDYDSSTFINDITLIILDRDVDETDPNTGFICLDPASHISPESRFVAIGWGFTNPEEMKCNFKF